MPTKAELEIQITELEHKIRRLDRSLNQTRLDLEELPTAAYNRFETPHRNDNVVEALERAMAEYEAFVKDPSERISLYIKSSHGIGWSWEADYVKNGQFAWCGAFAAWCHTRVKFDIRKKIFPSCYRLYANWGQTSRKIDPMKVQPGDIVVVYTSKRSMQGDHITLCVDNSLLGSEGEITTIEGNAHGTFPDDSYGEGVIKRKRKLIEFAHVYRLLADDFDER
jgi:hypothetical protein|tara:strand:- start:152 stop:820 length:669 start_codon:yes stop_codon:yes gene_type:complete